MSTVTIEIASDVAEDKFDYWLEVRKYISSPCNPGCHGFYVEFTMGEGTNE